MSRPSEKVFSWPMIALAGAEQCGRILFHYPFGRQYAAGFVPDFYPDFYFVATEKAPLLGLGRFQFAKTIQHNQQQYYIEEVVFADRQQAIHGYFRLVPMLQQYGNVLESEYDFFDFYSVVLRFEDCSMKLVRR